MPVPDTIRPSSSAAPPACGSSSPKAVRRSVRSRISAFRSITTGSSLVRYCCSLPTESPKRRTPTINFIPERLAKALATAATVDAQHVVAAVIDDVSRFVGDAEQADDMTVLALRRVGAAATGP